MSKTMNQHKKDKQVLETRYNAVLQSQIMNHTLTGSCFVITVQDKIENPNILLVGLIIMTKNIA